MLNPTTRKDHYHLPLGFKNQITKNLGKKQGKDLVNADRLLPGYLGKTKCFFLNTQWPFPQTEETLDGS